MNERIKELREYLGLSRAAFGEQLGVSGDVINNLERGRVEIKEDRIKLICSVFNVNEHWLRTGEGDPYGPQTRNQEIIEFANKIMADEDESFRKRFVSALGKARPEFWDELEKIVDETLKKD